MLSVFLLTVQKYTFALLLLCGLELACVINHPLAFVSLARQP